MFKKLLIVGFVFFLVMGGAFMAPLEAKEGKYGKSIPVIAQSFASPTVRTSGVWKVYLKASDPDGDMKNLYASVFQYGLGTYPISITRIKQGDDKNLNGYFYLYTGHEPAMQFANLIITLWIQDKAGHFSAPTVFPLALNAWPIQENPPQGVFQEKDLGPIMVTLRSPSDG